MFYDAASSSRGLELNPCVVVAAAVGGKTAPACAVREPRMIDAPDTSSLAAGLVLPIPTLPPDSKIAEFSMLQAVVNFEISLAVAVPSLVIAAQAVAGVTANAATLARLAAARKPDCEVAEIPRSAVGWLSQ